MNLRRLTALLSLCGLLVTNSVGYTSVCAILCASHAEHGSTSTSPVPHHSHHSSQLIASRSAHSHAGQQMDMQHVTRGSGEITLNSSPCTQYKTVVTVLDASRISLGETNNTAPLANLLAIAVGRALVGLPLEAGSPSPPQSHLPHLSAPIFLRI